VTAVAWLRKYEAGIAVLVCAACALGALWLPSLPSALYPEVVFPRVVIVATLPGSNARTMQLSVTRPVEEGISSILGVRRVRSRTIRAASEISVWFDPDSDMDRALQLINSKLAEVRSDLPRNTGLVAERISPSSFPILTLAVTGNAPPTTLRDIGLYTVRPRLAGLPGMGLIKVIGGDVREIEVIIDPGRLEAAKLDLPRLASAIADALPVEAVGRVDIHYQQHLVIVRGPVENPLLLERTVVGGTPELPVRLRDVARIQESHADRLLLTSANGRPATLINVGRRPGADAVRLAADVRGELDRLRHSLPPGIEILVTYDQASLIGKAVRNVRDAVFLGGLLTLVVIGLFLRSPPATAVAAASLPATLLMTFAAMKLSGASLNLMSLGGLAVAIGLVVDDAVVVVEAVHRRVAQGQERWAATSEALREIAWPVVNSTLTTVVVFAPLSLLSGVAGQFFSALAFTLCAAVLLSLAVALGITPLLCGRLLRPHESQPLSMQGPYLKLMERTLERPKTALAIAGAALVALGLIARGVGTGFLPELDEGAFVVDYFTPTGTSLTEADRLSRRVEATVVREPEVAVTSRRLGAELGPPAATEASRGDISVELSPDRNRSSGEVIASAREAVATAAPGVRVEFVELLQDMLSDLEGASQPVEVKLLGADSGVLREFAPKVGARLKDIRGLVDLYDGVSGCAPEQELVVNSDAAGRLGLTAMQVADQVRDALLGQVVTYVPRSERLIGVRVRLEDSTRFNPEVIGQLRIRPPNGAPVPLTALATVKEACLPSELLEENLRPMVAVTGRLEQRDLGSVTAEVADRTRDLPLPSGVQLVLGGQYASQQESFRSLTLVLALAVLGVFTVLAFHFRNFVAPLLILAAAPVALAAGAAALRITGVPLNVSSFMGCILLIGLVVKNGILLLDHAEADRARGASAKEAALSGASVRLRPILMTTFATLLGLAPLALGLGTGAEIQRPLAIAVIGGLSISTLSVLVVLPVLYVLVQSRRRLGSQPSPESASTSHEPVQS
jgi:CzcA family heavy metal efflux pump